jgi:hypothetical protein
MAMKLFTGWAMSAGLIVAASAANAQMLAPTDVGRAHYRAASDVQGPAPYAGLPPEAPATRYGPALLPPLEVYTVVRENGFSPLGIPRQRGYVYVIAVIDRAGEDGRLIIDARNGQIIRFVPAFRAGGYYGEDYPPPYGPAGPGPYGAPGLGRYGPEGRYGTQGRYGTEGRYGVEGSGPYGSIAPGPAGTLPPTASVGGGPRPPASIPRVASRTVPVPAAKPTDLSVKPDLAAKPDLANKPAPEPKQQSVAVQAKPADAPAAPPPAAPPAIAQAKPVPSIQPTQEMPKVQGLE